MALIVEDGSVVTGANSYADEATIEAYLTARGHTFTAIVEADVLRAMIYIDSLPWKGTRYDEDQELAWPRDGVYDADDFLIETDEIPDKVIYALCEAAYKENQSSGTLLPDEERTVIRQTVDVITTEYERGSSQLTKFNVITRLLKGLIEGGSSKKVLLA